MKEISKLKNVCCIGAGYVGGPTCAVIADKCDSVKVTVIDHSEEKIKAWLSDSLPIYEPGLDEIIKRCLGKNLYFSTDMENAIAEADIIFICVNTPTKNFGIGSGKATDLSNLEKAARLIAQFAKTPKVVVEKSTVPVKAAQSIKLILSANHKKYGKSLHHIVMSNPEFLSEGRAIKDLTKPDRVLIGVDETCEMGRQALQMLSSLYTCWVPSNRIITMSTWSSELSKLAANAFLAQKVSSINSMSAVCESTGADICEVADAIGRDHRIGPYFLNTSIGFGGSCFKKDVLNLVYICESLQMPEVAKYWQSVIDMNEFQKMRSAKRIFHGLMNSLKDKIIAIWGFTFKENTKDTRESAAIDLCKFLLEEEATLHIYDPRVDPEQIFTDLNIKEDNIKVSVAKSEIEASIGATAIIICTEWTQFKNIDFEEVYQFMSQPAFIFDGRLILDHDKLRSIGFQVEAVGIPSPRFKSVQSKEWFSNCDCKLKNIDNSSFVCR